MTSVTVKSKERSRRARSPDVAWQTDSYIIGDKAHLVRAGFTYHAYRFMEIDGLRRKPQGYNRSFHPYKSGSGKSFLLSKLINNIQKTVKGLF